METVTLDYHTIRNGGEEVQPGMYDRAVFESKRNQPPVITVDADEVEARGGWGHSVAQVRVCDDKGRVATFHLNVRITNKGQAEGLLTAMKTNTETIRHAVASWKTP
jgi:hypothetical protein